MTLSVGVVGAGLIGSRRARTAAASPRSRLLVVVDQDAERARGLADHHGCRWTTSWEEAVADPSLEALVVSVVNKFLAPISTAALEAGKHVLTEKPPGRDATEAAAMREAAARSGRVLKVGFNLRFHPALRRAREICAAGGIGEPYFLRSIYGHGGRPGYAAEWRGDPELAGGGELLDQGVHLLDLAGWFLGDLEPAGALLRRWHWEIGPLEDNAFVLLETRSGRVASLHTSWTQWRNRFTLDVHGSAGSVAVEGLGGSYGPETLTACRRRPEAGSPEEEVTVFDGPDLSWEADWADFCAAALDGRPPEVGGDQGVAVMRLVDRVYRLGGGRPGAVSGAAPAKA